MKDGVKSALGLMAGILILQAAQAADRNAEIGTFKPDDGTYRVEAVSSPEECSALCEADAICRGAVTFQPDVTRPEAVCRLNNGFGENAVFPAQPPEPLDLDIALSELNAYRAAHGLGPVRLDASLNAASHTHATDLARAGIASHTGTDGSSHAERVSRAGYAYSLAAENVATGQKSWSQVFKAWQDSPGHNVNLLQPEVTDFGIALVYEPTTTYSTYWAMLVAAPLAQPSVASLVQDIRTGLDAN